MNKARHWQDPLNAVVGVAMLASPWAFGYQFRASRLTEAAAWTST